MGLVQKINVFSVIFNLGLFIMNLTVGNVVLAMVNLVCFSISVMCTGVFDD